MAFYPTVVSSKGRVAIPTELRKKFGLKKGTRATWSEEPLGAHTYHRAAPGPDYGFSQANAGQAVSVRGVF